MTEQDPINNPGEESESSFMPTPDIPAAEALPEAVSAPPKPKRTGLYIAAALVFVVVLAGAAYLAGRLFNQRSNLSNGGPVMLNPGGGASVKSFSMEIDSEPPEELPKTSPDTLGLFVKRDDNVLTLGTGEGNSVIVTKGESSGGATAGEPLVSNSEYSGPEVEVVINKDTKIYRENTFDNLNGSMPPEGEKIKRTVVEGTLDEIGQNSFITVWGRKSGDRYIADVILFSSPVMFKNP